MSDLYLDPSTHDLDIINGDIRLIQNVEETARQKLAITLNTFRGEWFANISFGIPYLQNDNNPIQLLGVNTKRLLDVAFKEAILEKNEIVKIINYESILDKPSRTLVVNADVETESGDITQFNLTLNL